MTAETDDLAPDPARRRIAQALRQLGHRFVGHDAPAETLDAVAVQLEQAVGRLAAGPIRSRQNATPNDVFAHPADGQPIRSHESRPFSGAASPWGCELDVHREGEEAVARFTLGAAHEGASNRSHGGIVAGIFDDVFGMVLQIHQQAAFTGELAVRYEAAVPLHRPLVVRARLSGRERRKLFMTADGWDRDRRLVTATATFIAHAT